jgi:uncharacterized protein
MPPHINPAHANCRLRVSRSSIHRWGVYALESIPRGLKVIEYTGDRLTQAQATQRVRRNKRLGAERKNVYLARLNRRWLIDGAVGGSGAQFVNHCCDPNLVPRRLQGGLWFVCRRGISRGEELTIDYDYERNALKTPCKCGSPKCRGTMNRR